MRYYRAPVKPLPPANFTVADTLWQDPRDPKGELICRICEAGVEPHKYEEHVAQHNQEGWVKLG